MSAKELVEVGEEKARGEASAESYKNTKRQGPGRACLELFSYWQAAEAKHKAEGLRESVSSAFDGARQTPWKRVAS